MLEKKSFYKIKKKISIAEELIPNKRVKHSHKEFELHYFIDTFLKSHKIEINYI